MRVSVPQDAGAGLEARARRLTGAPDLAKAPHGRNSCARRLETEAADRMLDFGSVRDT